MKLIIKKNIIKIFKKFYFFLKNNMENKVIITINKKSDKIPS